MTTWQENLIEALVSSPTSFEYFKLKQKNKNLMYQYLHRIFPYKRIRENRNFLNIKSKIDKEKINHIISSNINRNIYNILCKHDLSESSINIGFSTTKKDIITVKYHKNITSILKKYSDLIISEFDTPLYKDIKNNNDNFNKEDSSRYKNSIINIIVKLCVNSKLSINQDNVLSGFHVGNGMNPRNGILAQIEKSTEEHSCKNNFSRELVSPSIPRKEYILSYNIGFNNLTFLFTIINDLSTIIRKNFTIEMDNIYIPSNTINFIKKLYIIQRELNLIVENNNSKSYKPTYIKNNNLNVGIEIEHEAKSSTNQKIINKILRHNCSYDSGFDGDMISRLRENRIRLDGIKGLKGLWILLEDMKKNTYLDACHSSVHMHIDCKYDNSFKYIKCDDLFKKQNKNLISKYFTKLFELPTFNINFFYDLYPNKIHYSNEFNTVEYRICIVTLEYYKYVLQILALIHVTECLKHRCKMNENYLKILLKIKYKCDYSNSKLL